MSPFQTFFQRIVAFFTSIFVIFPSFVFSFLPFNQVESFEVPNGVFSEQEITLNGKSVPVCITGDYTFEEGKLIVKDKVLIELSEGECDWFNYFALLYTSDAYLKCEITYIQKDTEKSEEFFLEKAESSNTFYSFIDDYLIKKKANKVVALAIQPLDNSEATLTIDGVATFNRKVEKRIVYTQNDYLKIGIDLDWGGSLSYLEDLNSKVEAVKKDGTIKVDSNASKRYGKIAVNRHVNLLNCNDSGRLVQQSYYGGDSTYEKETYMEYTWPYNPVQGGNQYNESSKIVDLKVTEEYIYVKCRPLDWAKSKEYISPSYMEATYLLEDNLVKASCRFVDFSGYQPYYTQQEMPAFYCVEPLNKFYYVKEGELTCEEDLTFWAGDTKQHYKSSEDWTAFAGEFHDSFGVGLYTPNSTLFKAGVFQRGETDQKDPSTDDPTSYIALVKSLTFCSYKPIEYSFALTTGSVNEIRDTFNNMK